LQQVRDDVGTAEANLKLAQITAERYSGLLQQDSISKQDVDTAVQNAAARATALRSAQANVRRLEELVSFERIYAPFDGVITARNTDVGQLIASGVATAGNRELFHIAAVNRLRVFVNVPQLYSHLAKVGMTADLSLPDLPGRRFPGTLVRTSDSFDQATRTLLAEVDVDNPTGVLFANAYTEVHFKMKATGTTLVIPATSLIFRSEGLRVPVVRNGNRVSMVPVNLGRDFGNTVEVLSGLQSDSPVVSDPPDSLVDGESIRVVPKKVQADDEH
jgi:RND family efflux transporter MFP subunit